MGRPLTRSNGSPGTIRVRTGGQRNWMFTANNPTQEVIGRFYRGYTFSESNLITYLVAQLERGERGTLHLQGYVEFDKPLRLRRAQEVLGMGLIHLESRKGTQDQAIEYCMKQESRVRLWREDGEKAQQGKRNDLSLLLVRVASGWSRTKIRDTFGATYARNYRMIDREIALKQTLDRAVTTCEPPEVIVLWGLTGTGKSHKALDMCKERGLVPYPASRGSSICWWDGLEFGGGFDAIIFNDFVGWESYDNILRLCDKYATILQHKGRQVICPPLKLIIFTSNLHPTDWWWKTHAKELLKHGTHLSAFARRITKIEHLTEQRDEVGGTVTLVPPNLSALAVGFVPPSVPEYQTITVKDDKTREAMFDAGFFGRILVKGKAITQVLKEPRGDIHKHFALVKKNK